MNFKQSISIILAMIVMMSGCVPKSLQNRLAARKDLQVESAWSNDINLDIKAEQPRSGLIYIQVKDSFKQKEDFAINLQRSLEDKLQAKGYTVIEGAPEKSIYVLQIDVKNVEDSFIISDIQIIADQTKLSDFATGWKTYNSRLRLDFAKQTQIDQNLLTEKMADQISNVF